MFIGLTSIWSAPASSHSSPGRGNAVSIATAGSYSAARAARTTSMPERSFSIRMSVMTM